MISLNEIYSKYSYPEGHGDKGTAHTYIDEYERLLSPYRNGITFLEIGLSHGESIQMWSEFFSESKIYGIDINDHHLKHLLDNKNFNIVIGDGTKSTILSKFPENLNFDVIIDDGSHKLNDQINSFNLFKDRMNDGGIYIIEDIENYDRVKDTLLSLHTNSESIDNRRIKNRKDDVLIVYRF